MQRDDPCKNPLNPAAFPAHEGRSQQAVIKSVRTALFFCTHPRAYSPFGGWIPLGLRRHRQILAPAPILQPKRRRAPRQPAGRRQLQGTRQATRAGNAPTADPITLTTPAAAACSGYAPEPGPNSAGRGPSRRPPSLAAPNGGLGIGRGWLKSSAQLAPSQQNSRFPTLGGVRVAGWSLTTKGHKSKCKDKLSRSPSMVGRSD